MVDNVPGVLHVHRAERADTLADALAGVLAQVLADPFAAEVVAVPERGVERWLAQRLAHRLGTRDGRADGVCANVRFPSPAEVVDEVVCAATGVDPADDPWRPARAVWPLLELVDEAAAEPGFALLGAHLGTDSADAHRRGRRYALARRLAELYASYAAHRPGMLGEWLAGADVDAAGGAALAPDLRWQAELWRRLRARIGVPGPAERVETACALLRADPGRAALGPRLSVFGPTRLAASRLTVLAALAVHRDVHLWLAHPSPVLWAALTPQAGTAPRRADDASAAVVANPLLASLGRDVRELQLRLPVGTDVHHPGPPPPPTLLGALQCALRDDVAPGAVPTVLDPADRSVQVHACHGPDRQVEVLREVVLGLLAADPTLEPRDVVVMCPDIETFAPLISATFGLAAGTDDDTGHPGHRLPVRLADRALRQVNPLLDTVATLLELADARLTATQVLDLAATEPVRRRFRFDDDALDRLRDLVVGSGVRWGLDADHRGPFALGAFAQNTWSAGLDRMLLGVAMDEADRQWLGTALPLDDVGSSDVDTVGRFAELLDRLAAVLAGLRGERTLAEWGAALAAGLDALTTTTPTDAWQAAQARAELAEVTASAGPHAASVPLGLPDVRGLLADRLRGRPTRANFRTGTLTVATLVPMRSVPHRVVCLLGLDDGAFPRAGEPDGDDALARDPRVGERDPRSEDRQLLLDAVGAATEHLVVVHSGADERTGVRRPPSVPVGELLDALDAVAVGPDGRRARDHVVVRHPLQPFDTRNFAAAVLGGPGPFSFDRAALAGARAATGVRTPPPRPLPGPLPVLPPPAEVELDDLVRFLEGPAKAFLRQRVGVSLFSADDDPDDALPVELDQLQRWHIGARLLADRLAGHDLDACRAAEWRRGALPPGGLGRRILDEVAADVEPIVAATLPLRSAPPESLDVSAVVAGTRVVGTVGGVVRVGSGPGATGDIVSAGFSRLGAKQRVGAWVRLLALTAARPDTTWRAVTIGRGSDGPERSVLGPVEPGRAAVVLADLLALHRDGLCAALPLVLKASHAYAGRRRLRNRTVEDAVDAARSAWAGRFSPERDEPAHRLLWGPSAPLEDLLSAPARTGEEPSLFGELAMRVWTPLLAAEEVSLP
ncbi:exodeoxyribonuclease V subunit gamma [Pseudonocardia dioxanivorans]|uniref:exodeoxyribonuclease V subunit gamma n=1 Tax=Pseudonocardia dioxanivorans TaxID=240495 RepID=UPI00031425B4|nr:exodeoxyribonuclease V subunit gamma [Pseudonocardia dioxanivorans]